MPTVAVFDTNVLFSGLGWKGKPYECLELARAGSIKGLTCIEILDEWVRPVRFRQQRKCSRSIHGTLRHHGDTEDTEIGLFDAIGREKSTPSKRLYLSANRNVFAPGVGYVGPHIGRGGCVDRHHKADDGVGQLVGAASSGRAAQSR